MMHSAAAVDVPDLLGTIHPFLRANPSFVHTLSTEVNYLVKEKQARKILSCMGLNLLCTFVLLVWCNSTDSLALTAYTYLTIFDMMSMLTCLVTLWVRSQHPSPFFSFGYERFEVLAVFASTILAQFGALFIVKESVERMVQQPDVHTGRLLVGTVVGFMLHMFVTYSIENRAFNHVIQASSSSWLQEHVTDMSESLCHVVPGLAKLLLPRINPFALITCGGAMALVITHILIDMRNYYAADTWAAVWIALMTCGTMFPMSVYSGKILLQTTPSHIIGQLDKCIREASTLDGVLEFRHEHFWTVAFGMMAGSVHVRVRRDADEQMVLAHVYNRLANLVSVLTVQIFKDDWSRPSAFQILGDPTLLSKTTESRQNLAASTVAGVPNAGTLPYLTGTQLIGSASYRAASPLTSGSERPEARQFIGGHGVAGSVLTSHAGVRFASIPHYTDMSGLSSSAKYVVSGSIQGHTGSSLQSAPTVKIQEDKHK